MNPPDTAQKLEAAVETLQCYISDLRGEILDNTGRGLWGIFCSQLEEAMQIKIIDKSYWKELSTRAPGVYQ
jgi:hypothetical protein